MGNKYLEKIASDAEREYSGPSNWQTAGLVAGAMPAAGYLSSLISSRSPSMDRVNQVTRKLEYRARARRMHHFNSRLYNKAMDVKFKTPAYKVLKAGLASPIWIPGAVAAYRQYQDYKNDDTTPRYGRGALIGAAAGLAVPGGINGSSLVGAGLGLGAVGAHHIYQKLKNKEQEKIASENQTDWKMYGTGLAGGVSTGAIAHRFLPMAEPPKPADMSDEIKAAYKAHKEAQNVADANYRRRNAERLHYEQNVYKGNWYDPQSVMRSNDSVYSDMIDRHQKEELLDDVRARKLYQKISDLEHVDRNNRLKYDIAKINARDARSLKALGLGVAGALAAAGLHRRFKNRDQELAERNTMYRHPEEYNV